MARVFPMIAALALSATVAFVACGGGDAGGDPSPKSPPAATPTTGATPDAGPTATTAPQIVTGIPAIDDALAAAIASDVAALLDQLRYVEIGCRNEPQGMPSVPSCPPGMPDGTIVESFATAQCEGAYIMPGDAEDAVRRFLQPALALYAVYVVPENYFPENGSHSIVLEATGGEIPWTAREMVIGEDGIVLLNYGCGESSDVLATNRGLVDPIARRAE